MFGDFFWVVFLVIFVPVVLFLLKYKQLYNENNSLKKQLHDRVKNNMQLAYSLINLQKRYVNNSNVSTELDDTHKRLATLSFINKAYLFENIVNNSISVSAYKEVFINKLFNKYQAEKSLLSKASDTVLQINFSFQYIDIEKALPLGLIINELLLILFKKGFGKEQYLNINVNLLKNKLSLKLPNNDAVNYLSGYLEDGLSRKIIYRLAKQLELNVFVNNKDLLLM